MMGKTEIQWTDFTWNPVTGCTKVSQGCRFCYAETIANRFWKDRKFTDVICHPERLDQPSHLKKPRMIFVNSMSDLFHPGVPFEFIDKVLNVMATNPQHTYQILTKRPERLLEWCKHQNAKLKKIGFDHIDGKYFELPDFIWIGVSVEDQKSADERVPILQDVPAAIRFLSIEPMLEEISIGHLLRGDASIRGIDQFFKYKVNWVIIGCESGAKRRECKIEWVEKLVKECREAPIPVFVKQLQINSKVVDDINQFPEHLRIRQFPNGTCCG
jgi:protein gp37